MSAQVQAAIIAAAIALLTAIFSSYFTFIQFQREKNKWLIDLKTSYSVELYKTRLAEYPHIFILPGQLSKHSPNQLTPQEAQQIGNKIHEWLYSPGGLCAESSTRGALRGLRYYCQEWKQGTRPPEMTEWRHYALFLLRRDLDLQGFESFDPKDSEPLLRKLRTEVASLQ